MKMYKIVPLERAVIEVIYNGEYDGMKTHLPYDWFDHIRLNRAGDMIFVNDTGMIDGTEERDGSFWWTYPNGQAVKLFGEALLWGTNGEDSADPSMTIPEVYASISWTKPEGAQEPNPELTTTTFNSVDVLFEHILGNKVPWD